MTRFGGANAPARTTPESARKTRPRAGNGPHARFEHPKRARTAGGIGKMKAIGRGFSGVIYIILDSFNPVGARGEFSRGHQLDGNMFLASGEGGKAAALTEVRGAQGYGSQRERHAERPMPHPPESSHAENPFVRPFSKSPSPAPRACRPARIACFP